MPNINDRAIVHFGISRISSRAFARSRFLHLITPDGSLNFYNSRTPRTVDLDLKRHVDDGRLFCPSRIFDFKLTKPQMLSKIFFSFTRFKVRFSLFFSLDDFDGKRFPIANNFERFRKLVRWSSLLYV